jgi:voltage-gated potassium channel
MWGAIVTATTGGYGDLYPKTVASRVVAMLLMLVGIGFISVLTAAVASVFVKTDRQDEHARITEALARIEAELAEVKTRLGAP